MYLILWIRCNTHIPCRPTLGTSIVKNPKILVEEAVRSTAVGTLRISQCYISHHRSKNVGHFSHGSVLCIRAYMYHRAVSRFPQIALAQLPSQPPSLYTHHMIMFSVAQCFSYRNLGSRYVGLRSPTNNQYGGQYNTTICVCVTPYTWAFPWLVGTISNLSKSVLNLGSLAVPVHAPHARPY
jgi:hypothetical protein